MHRTGRLVSGCAVAILVLWRASGAGHAQQGPFHLVENWTQLARRAGLG